MARAKTYTPPIPTAQRVEQVATALRATRGVVSEAAAICGISRRRVHALIQKHPELRAICDDERERLVDVAESRMLDLMEAGEFKAVAFVLRCFGKQRGWVDREVRHLHTGTVEHDHGGEIKVDHAHRLALNELDQNADYVEFIRHRAANDNARRLRDGGVPPGTDADEPGPNPEMASGPPLVGD